MPFPPFYGRSIELMRCRWLGDAASVSAKAKTVVKVRTDGDTGEPTAVRIPDHLDILVCPSLHFSEEL